MKNILNKKINVSKKTTIIIRLTAYLSTLLYMIIQLTYFQIKYSAFSSLRDIKEIINGTGLYIFIIPIVIAGFIIATIVEIKKYKKMNK